MKDPNQHDYQMEKRAMADKSDLMGNGDMVKKGERKAETDLVSTRVRRRTFCKATAFGVGSLLGGSIPEARAMRKHRFTLLPPVETNNSTEIALNSRASVHSGLNGSPTLQQISNVLWAAGRAPFHGQYRTILFKDATGTYTYDPDSHTLTYDSSGTTGNGFRITYHSENDYDSGISYTYALSASVALWTGTQSQLASCPMGSDIVFGIRSIPKGLTLELVAASSDQSLTNPTTDGDNVFEQVIAKDNGAHRFQPYSSLPRKAISQILWGGYGCTPHTVNGGRAGLTVPSSWAEYNLSDRIYVLDHQVSRYVNRVNGDLTTTDHRLEMVDDSNRRADIRQILPELKNAPAYIILCLTQSGTTEHYSRLEAGFTAGGVILQANALDYRANFKTGLSSSEQTAIQAAAGLPAGDIPVVALAVGKRHERMQGYKI